MTRLARCTGGGTLGPHPLPFSAERWPFILALGGVLGLTVLACQSRVALPPPLIAATQSQEEEARAQLLFAEGLELLHQGDPGGARVRFLRIVEALPGTRYSAAALREAGRASLLLGDVGIGIGYLERYLEHVTAEFRLPVYPLLTRGLLEAGAPTAAARRLLEIPAEETAADRRELLLLMAEAAQALPSDSLLTLAEAAPAHPLRGALLLRAARLALFEADVRRAEVLAREALAFDLPSDLREEAESIRSGRYRDRYERNNIGVLLPLNGPLREPAEEVLRGVRLGLEEARLPHPLNLVIRPSDGPEGGLKALYDLANESEVLAVIGPLLSQRVLELAPAIQARGLPLVTPTARELSLAAYSPPLYALTLPTPESAESIGALAVLALGLDSLLALSPAGSTGDLLVEAFQRGAARHGGRLIAWERYPQGTTTFAEPLLAFRRLVYGEEEIPELTDLPFDSLLAVVAPESLPATSEPLFRAGLFLPGLEGELLQLAPQVPYYGLHEVQLLGEDGWYSERLARLGGQYVDGAIFASSLSPRHRDRFSAFRQAYETRYRKEPTLTAALGYDAVQILLAALPRERYSRNGLRDGLTGPSAVEGAVAQYLLRPSGGLTRTPHFFTIRRGKLLELDPDTLHFATDSLAAHSGGEG